MNRLSIRQALNFARKNCRLDFLRLAASASPTLLYARTGSIDAAHQATGRIPENSGIGCLGPCGDDHSTATV
jgi:hypothetical protein